MEEVFAMLLGGSAKQPRFDSWTNFRLFLKLREMDAQGK